MTDRLFDLDPLEDAQPAAPAPPPPAPPARPRRPMRRDRTCEWTHKDRVSRVLDALAEHGACPACGALCAVTVVAFLSR